ncbi:DNA/RNA non-specific endonuclease [Acinetobacter shaoyimingii]|uniref:Endonuclease n=1 Tax=Acinetobacter shaoyimingii TaxID=2715164 RepID=A0A6G8RS06_9GAMM|nr:DNA/RNA non-specific endonuclease [Acinetobacter shaoyimingii]NHB56812.1 DNA/RNA non-specific endonuclease [Acinetobacter shaoyimingii]QIO04684.1 DNA/RNA non-specific endonuclease [Acinetobacter shaoyimingii]
MKNVVLKSVLGVVAAGSFAFAFGEEKITQYIPFTNTTIDTTCLKQFYRDEPPVIVKESLKKNTYPLCFNGFNVMYSGVSKTPLWTAEYLSVSRLSQKIKREDSFHEELRVDASDRATLADYKASGYDRGHMSPNADMPTKESQFDSFSLANMVPQAPKNNQQVWRELEEAVRAIVTKQKQDVYVVTGPIFSGKKLKTIGKGVIVPTAVFKAIYLPSKGIIGAYYAPNDNSLQVKVISVCQLEEEIGMNIFPQLTTDQKRNTYKLPLSSTQVKANKMIEYAHWDGESQCAVDVSDEQIQVLQKQFSQSGGSLTKATTTKTSISKTTENTAQKDPQSDTAEQMAQDILEKILSAIWQYFVQMLK